MDDPQAGPSSDSPPRKPLFIASKEWFAKFQKCFGLKSVSVHGEDASAAAAAAEEYVKNDFKKIIEEECNQGDEAGHNQCWKSSMTTVIRAFMALYTRNALVNLVDSMDVDKEFALKT
ncbi:hypothetical protein SK128_000966, partial [Halocaridina rubra]